MKFGLETSRALAGQLGHPERAYPTLLIAGTNGKGSVAAYVDAALRASGLRVGRYTSPHLVRVHERIVVGGREISDAALGRAVSRVRAAADRLLAAQRIASHPTYFEVLTLAAFDYFRRSRVEVAVLEVGLGGRLDATNICEPLVSAIVSVDRDHEAYLGTTLSAIAREKAGVMREGRAVVTGPLPVAAARMIRLEARRTGARLVEALRGARLRVVGRPALGLLDEAPSASRPAAAGMPRSSRCRAATSVTTRWWRSACSRRRTPPACRSSCEGCHRRFAPRPGLVACNICAAA